MTKTSTKSSAKAELKPGFVLDSSVAIKWFTKEEPFSEQAKKILEDYLMGRIEIFIPDIFWWEIGNYFGRKADLATATVILMNLKKYRFPTYMLTDGLSVRAFKLMSKIKKISFYDASYHSLAIQMKSKFVTSDKKYADKAKLIGSICYLPHYK